MENKQVRTETPADYNAGPGFDRQRAIDDETISLAIRILEARLAKAALEYGALTSPSMTRDYLRLKLAAQEREHFLCMFLDTRHRVIKSEVLFHGTVDQASVYPRVIIQRALELNASALIIAHNHPSGVAEPSQADLAITRRIRDAAGLMDIRLLDHFIVGSEEITSLAERGLT